MIIHLRKLGAVFVLPNSARTRKNKTNKKHFHGFISFHAISICILNISIGLRNDSKKYEQKTNKQTKPKQLPPKQTLI